MASDGKRKIIRPNSLFVFLSFCLLGLLGLKAAPVDSLVRDTRFISGKLRNGLTYYLCPNQVPKGKIHFRLVVNAGSTSESDAQQGLAHFLEHIAFKGSDSFPPGKLIPELEAVGVKLGRDLNARTKTDETVYYLDIAAEKSDLGLQVLRDWAGGLLLDSLMIEQERGVILEELRLGQGANTRMREKYYPVLLGGSPYPNRFVIGKEEVIATFPQEELRKFYRDCYRPDRMALVIIGDLDVENMRREVIQRFGDLLLPSKPLRLPDLRVPGHTEMKVAVVTDPEATTSVVELFYKHEPFKVATPEDFRKHLCHALFSTVLNMRLQERIDLPEAPFTESEAGYGSFNRGCDVYSAYAKAVAGKEMEVLRTLLYENKRMGDHGVSSSELKRAEKKVSAGYERRYTDRLKLNSAGLADLCQVEYLYGEPAVAIESEYKMAKAFLAEITPEEIRDLCKEYFTDRNRVVVITAPQREGVTYPSANEVQKLVGNFYREKTEPYTEQHLPETLMTDIPVPGKILREDTEKRSGIVSWTLSNGARVLLKTGDFNNTVIFRAVRDGGYSLFSPDCDSSALVVSEIADVNGVAGLSIAQMRKILTGCRISVSQSVGCYEHAMAGYFAGNDMEEFFQLLHLYQVAPSFEPDVFQRWQKLRRDRMIALEKDPDDYFNRQIDCVMTAGNPDRPLREAGKITLDTIAAVYKRLFCEPEGMTYIFAGNFVPEDIKPYVLTYLAGIPTEGQKRQSIPRHREYPQAPAEYVFHRGQEDKASVVLRFVKKADWDEYQSYCLNIFSELLSSRLFKAVREDMGGVYGVHLTDAVNRRHDPYAFFEVSFGTNVKMWKEVRQRTIIEMQKLMTDGPTREELERVKQKRRQSYAVNLQDNRVWASRMSAAALYGDYPGILLERGEMIERLTVEDIQKAARKYLDPSLPLTFVLLPEEMRALNNSLKY